MLNDKRSIDAYLYRQRIDPMRKLPQLLREVMEHAVGPEPGFQNPNEHPPSTIRMPGDLWADVITGQWPDIDHATGSHNVAIVDDCISLLDRCSKEMNKWKLMSGKISELEVKNGCQSTQLAGTMVAVKEAINWLYANGQSNFVAAGCKPRQNEERFAHAMVRMPIWKNWSNCRGAGTGFPSITFLLGDDEFNEMMKQAEDLAPLYGRGGASISGTDDDDVGSPPPVGTELLAWYVPFHHDRTNWGVYIPITGLLKLAAAIAPSGIKGHHWQTIINISLGGLISHELVHYAIEYRIAQLERMMEAPCYLRFKAKWSHPHGYVLLEEQLAEGALLRFIRSAEPADLPGIFHEAVEWGRQLPAGYCDGYKSVKTDEFLSNANNVMRNVAMSLSNCPVAVSADPSPMDFVGRRMSNCEQLPALVVLDGSQCPIYLIRDEEELNIPSDKLLVV